MDIYWTEERLNNGMEINLFLSPRW